VNPVDAWIDAIPDDQYAPCPCGCGMKWRFAIKDGIEKHEERFINGELRRVACGVRATERVSAPRRSDPVTPAAL
jgi:hypothetical protein